MEPRQRATPLVLLPTLLADLGVPADPVFNGTGVRPEDLRADAFIPATAVPLLLERGAERGGRQDFGLLLGQRQRLASLGPVGGIMASAATLGEALSDFVACQIGNSTASTVYLNRSGGDFALGYGGYRADMTISPQLQDMVLAAGCAFVAELTHGAVRPVELVTMRPAPKEPARWTRLADCPVRFGQAETCLILARGGLEARLPTADRARHDALLADLARRIAQAPWGKAGQVSHALRALLPAGRSGMAAMAERLGTTPRTLRRALAAEGTTFEAIKDRVRFAMAREVLALSTLPIGDIALTLDFATPSAFVRAFRRWAGEAPSDWRAKARAPR